MITLVTGIVLMAIGSSRVWLVDDDGPADFQTIQEAVNAAQTGDLIQVMPGTYTSTADEVVNLRSKGLRIEAVEGPEETIIDGQGTRRGVYSGVSGSLEVLEVAGFTFLNCEAVWKDLNDDGSISEDERSGGGVLVLERRQAVIENCKFVDCYARRGGGIACFGRPQNLRVSDSQFLSCEVEQSGAAVYLFDAGARFDRSEFILNRGRNGAGGSAVSGINQNLRFRDCLFDSNSSANSGGAIHGAIAYISNCRFLNNDALDGGALAGRVVRIVNTTFEGNSAQSGGAWIGNGSNQNDAKIIRTIFRNNQASAGGAIAATGEWIQFYYSSFIDNSSDTDWMIQPFFGAPRYYARGVTFCGSRLGPLANGSCVCGTTGACIDLDGDGLHDPCGYCPVDLTCDDVVDVFDVLDFIELLSAGDWIADWNGDAELDIFDVVGFLQSFEEGC